MKMRFSNLYGQLRLRLEDAGIGVRMLWQDSRMRLQLLFSLLFNAIAWSAAMFIVAKTTEEVIVLHHNIYFGITLIGAPNEVYFLPSFGMLVIVANYLFVYLLKEESRFFAHIFSASAMIVNIFLILALASIMLVNLS